MCICSCSSPSKTCPWTNWAARICLLSPTEMVLPKVAAGEGQAQHKLLLLWKGILWLLQTSQQEPFETLLKPGFYPAVFSQAAADPKPQCARRTNPKGRGTWAPITSPKQDLTCKSCATHGVHTMAQGRALNICFNKYKS